MTGVSEAKGCCEVHMSINVESKSKNMTAGSRGVCIGEESKVSPVRGHGGP
jgi:hypothetical protein